AKTSPTSLAEALDREPRTMKVMHEEAARQDELAGNAPIDSDVAVADTNEPGSTRRWTTPVLAALAVVGLATAAVFGTLYLSSEPAPEEIGAFLSDERPQIEERSRRVADLLVNYDSTTLEGVSAEMLEIATGNFREQYEETLSSGPGLSAALEEASASSRGEILEGPDVSFRTPSEAIAILSVTQTAQSNSNPGGQTFDYVLKITLIDTVDGGWKADRVEVISTQQV
ncbi:MAG: hypothetical protein ACRDI3_06570, partial [Actinomycetota bacterium]